MPDQIKDLRKAADLCGGKDMFKPVEVKASSDYKIWVRYADGVEGEVDLSHLAGRVSSQGQVKKIEFPMKKVDCEAQR